MEHLVESADGVVRDAAGGVWGVSVPTMLLAGDVNGATSVGRRIVRSGFVPLEEDPVRPDPRTWGPSGWAVLERAVRRAVQGMEGRLLIRPAWTDVISDAPSCVRFLGLRSEWGRGGGQRDEAGEERLGLLLDPVAMLAPTMMATAEDHVRRVLEIVSGHTGVDAVVAGGVMEIGEYRALVRADVPLVVGARGESGTTPYTAA